VERILEAIKTKAGPISLHDKLETLFHYYLAKLNFSIHVACKRSFKDLQLFLVNEVQRTYLAQGVQISDKHVEIIVKQMTSKVQVIDGNGTALLPGEIIHINYAELTTKRAVVSQDEPPSYKPMVLGLIN
jgi:DNA-directed RNA polymerase subunit beta'